MATFVTGGGGFAGQHLLRLLLDEGVEEITVGTLSGAAPGPGILTGAELERIDWTPLDVTRSSSIAEALARCRPERVYHLAGQASVAESFADPLATWEVNATGTLRLLDAVQALPGEPPRVLVISSAEVYGAVPEGEQPIREDAPLAPITPYGASKAAAEMVGLQAAATGLPVVLARSFNHTGPGQEVRFALPSMARQLAAMAAGTGERVLRVGNLQARRDFLDVRDVVRAYRFLLEEGRSGTVYNVCSGEARSLQELVETLVELSGTGARIEVAPERFRPVDIPLLVGDPARLAGLGWRPRIELRRTLGDLLAAEHG